MCRQLLQVLIVARAEGFFAVQRLQDYLFERDFVPRSHALRTLSHLTVIQVGPAGSSAIKANTANLLTLRVLFRLLGNSSA